MLKVCGGEDRAIGARMRFRIMPDDSFEFAVLVEAPDDLTEAANDNEQEAEAAPPSNEDWPGVEQDKAA